MCIIGLWAVLMVCVVGIVAAPVYGVKLNPEVTNIATTILGAIIGYVTNAVVKR